MNKVWLFIVLSVCSLLWAEVLTSWSGNSIKVENKTNSRQNIVGFRLESSSTIDGFQGWVSPRVSQSIIDDRRIYELVPTLGYHINHLNIFPDSSLLGVVRHGTRDLDASEMSNVESLYSLGTCNEKLIRETESPLNLNELKQELQKPSYYDVNYRYTHADLLGSKGGELSGGLFDSYVGETQMQFATPLGNVSYAYSSDYPWEGSNIANLTLMTNVMGQEFFGIDQQWMYAIGAKETFLGSDLHTQKNTNTDYAFGPWEVEASTFVSRALAYNQSFPYSSCLSDPARNAFFACGIDRSIFTANYLDEGGTTPLDHPKVVSAWLASALTFIYNYNLLSEGSDLGFFNALKYSSDPKVGACIMAPMYNLGTNAGGQQALYGLSEVKAQSIGCDDFADGNSQYKKYVIGLMESFEAAARNVLTDSSALLLDSWISLNDIRQFYFGDSVNLDSPWLIDGNVQNGGLIKHFDIGLQNKELMWKEIESAFNLQASHWGGGKISLRYDWLSNLRVAKKYLNLNLKKPQGEEYIMWVAKNSGNPKDVEGLFLDRTFPFVTMDTLVRDTSLNLRISFDVQDNRQNDRGISQVEWTVKDDWMSFNTSKISVVSGNEKSGIYELTLSQAELQELLTEKSNANLYVRVSDSCGNAVVTKIEDFSKGLTVGVLDQTNKLSNQSLDEEKPFDIYDSKGRLLGSYPSVYGPSFQNIQMGSYIIVQEGVSIKWIQP